MTWIYLFAAATQLCTACILIFTNEDPYPAKSSLILAMCFLVLAKLTDIERKLEGK